MSAFSLLYPFTLPDDPILLQSFAFYIYDNGFFLDWSFPLKSRFISNFLLDVSTWMSNKHLKLNIQNWTPQTAPRPNLPIFPLSEWQTSSAQWNLPWPPKITSLPTTKTLHPPSLLLPDSISHCLKYYICYFHILFILTIRAWCSYFAFCILYFGIQNLAWDFQ